jgi:hypothetical protein
MQQIRVAHRATVVDSPAGRLRQSGPWPCRVARRAGMVRPVKPTAGMLAFIDKFGEKYDPGDEPPDRVAAFSAAFPVALPAELLAYLRLTSEMNVEDGWASGELRAPALASLSDMTDPDRTGVFAPETLLAFLAGTVKLLDCGGDFSFGASVVAAADGASPVYRIDGNHDAGAAASFASLSAWCVDRVEDGDQAGASAKPKLPALLDPVRLGARSAWLAQAFCEHDNLAWDEILVEESRPTAFAGERELIAAWPHLATYWLWTLFLHGDARLAQCEALSAAHSHPAVVETRELIAGFAANQAAELPAVTPVDGAAITAIQARLVAVAGKRRAGGR